MNVRYVAGFMAVVLLVAGGCGSGAKVPPATPDGAVNDVVKGLMENKPQVVWQGLPPSYQKDVSELITTFANTCDADVYNQTFGLLKKAVKVVQTKKDILIASFPQDDTPAKKTPQQLTAELDSVVKVLESLLNSEISDLSKMKTLDVEKMLSTSGSQFMVSLREVAKMSKDPQATEFQDKMASAKATLIKIEGDTATVKLEAKGETPKEEQFKQVEGKWIPKDMADNWKMELAKAKKDLQDAVGKTQLKNKDMLLSQMKTLDGVLDQMMASKNKEELTGAMQGGLMAGLGLIMSLSAPDAPDAPAPAK